MKHFDLKILKKTMSAKGKILNSLRFSVREDEQKSEVAN